MSILNHMHIPSSPTLAISEKAKKLSVAGHDVINLSLGEPDIPPPQWVRDAVVEHVNDHYYTPIAGIIQLREAISEKIRAWHSTLHKASQVIVSHGAKQVLQHALMVSLNPGDEVIVPAPYWVSYPPMITIAQGQMVCVPCDENKGFKITPEVLEKNITSRTKWLILNSPNNPTGAVYSQQELCALGDVLARFPHVWVMCDDIYEDLVYTHSYGASLLRACSFLQERTLIVGGFSKSHSMTGWRLGYGAGPQVLIDAMIRLQSHVTSGTCSVIQRAGMAALTDSRNATDLQQRRILFQQRRDVLCDYLQKIQNFSVPEGAFYIFFPVKNDDDMVVAQRILEETYVSSVPGCEFGMPGFIRFSYALDTKRLHEAGERLLHWFKKI